MRSPVSVTQGAAGASAWIPLDIQQRPFVVALAASLDYLGNLTYTVQYSPDSPWRTQYVTISITGTTATMTFPAAHGLVVGDSVTVLNSGDTHIDGVYAVASVPSATTLTYTVSGTTLTNALPPCQCVPMRAFNLSGMTGLTARADGNFNAPVAAVRINVTAYTAGKVTLEVSQGHARG
jgi:hypothetical protein